MFSLKELSSTIAVSAIHARHGAARSLPAATTPSAHGLRQLAKHWVARHAVAALDELDDHLLNDAGLSRADIDWAKELPLSVNAIDALQQRGGRTGH